MLANNLNHWSLLVKRRDKYTCQMCNTLPTKECNRRAMRAHHIIPKRLAGSLAHPLPPELQDEVIRWVWYSTDNGITLCDDCHINRINRDGSIRSWVLEKYHLPELWWTGLDNYRRSLSNC